MTETKIEKTNRKGPLKRCLYFAIALMFWTLTLPWRLFTIPRRMRAADAKDAALRKEKQKAEHERHQAQLARENDVLRKREALLNIEEQYNFADGTDRRSGKTVSADMLVKMSIRHKSLLDDLGRAIPPRPYEHKTDQELWDLIGGENDDTHEALIFVMEDKDPVAQEAAATMLNQLRRDLKPLQEVDTHVKAVAELAARTRTQGSRFFAKEGPKRSDALRFLERRCRWHLYRNLRLDTSKGRRGTDGNFRTM